MPQLLSSNGAALWSMGGIANIPGILAFVSLASGFGFLVRNVWRPNDVMSCPSSTAQIVAGLGLNHSLLSDAPMVVNRSVVFSCSPNVSSLCQMTFASFTICLPFGCAYDSPAFFRFVIRFSCSRCPWLNRCLIVLSTSRSGRLPPFTLRRTHGRRNGYLWTELAPRAPQAVRMLRIGIWSVASVVESLPSNGPCLGLKPTDAFTCLRMINPVTPDRLLSNRNGHFSGFITQTNHLLFSPGFD
jgi:hypothetical protein